MILELTITPNEFLRLLSEIGCERPTAYWQLCDAAGLPVDEVPELPTHAKDGFWEGDSPEALAHIEKHFGISNLPRLMQNGNWDT